MKLSKLADAKPKKKCCRSSPRCQRCPVVIQAVRKAHQDGTRGKKLQKVYRRARRRE